MSVLEISALNKRYGTVQAVKDISFTLESGDILGIVGESGCALDLGVALCERC